MRKISLQARVINEWERLMMKTGDPSMSDFFMLHRIFTFYSLLSFLIHFFSLMALN